MSGEVVGPNAQVEAHTPQTTVAPVIDDRTKPIAARKDDGPDLLATERHETRDLNEDEDGVYSDEDDDEGFDEFDG